MASFNRVILVGNLTRDPELPAHPQWDGGVGDWIGSERSCERNNDWVDETTFVDVTLWLARLKLQANT